MFVYKYFAWFHCAAFFLIPYLNPSCRILQIFTQNNKSAKEYTDSIMPIIKMWNLKQCITHSNSPSQAMQGSCAVSSFPYTSFVKHGSFFGHFGHQDSWGGVGWRGSARHHHRAIAFDHIPHFSVRRQQYTRRQTAFARSTVKTFGSRGWKQRVFRAACVLKHALLIVGVVVFGMKTPAEAEDATFAAPTWGEDWTLKTQRGLRRQTSFTNTLTNKSRNLKKWPFVKPHYLIWLANSTSALTVRHIFIDKLVSNVFTPFF